MPFNLLLVSPLCQEAQTWTPGFRWLKVSPPLPPELLHHHLSIFFQPWLSTFSFSCLHSVLLSKLLYPLLPPPLQAKQGSQSSLFHTGSLLENQDTRRGEEGGGRGALIGYWVSLKKRKRKHRQPLKKGTFVFAFLVWDSAKTPRSKVEITSGFNGDFPGKLRHECLI